MRSFVALHLAVLLFGAAGVFGKYIALTSLSLVFGRTFFAALSLLPFVHWKDLRLSDNWLELLLSGGLLAVHWLTFFASLTYASVAFGLMGFATFPVFVAILEPWFFKQRRQRRDLLIAFLVVVGLIVMVSDATWQDGSLRAIAMGALSGLSFALLTLSNRGQSRRASSMQIAFVQNSAACLLLTPLVLYQQELASVSLLTWLLLATLGIVFTALSHSLFAFSLKQLSASLVSVTAALEPVYGMVLAYVVLGEHVSMQNIAGAAIVLLTTTFAGYLGSQHASDLLN
ncbi:DMT family transporter [Undibacterium sp. RuRC25W]|uniref:DMT family transporter n=1 Tax=Undibacterium sp. RuRC25W TaxID=3413047 RepID=UPI003BF06C75